jgi:ribosome maturation protein Sdo1
MSDYTVVRLKRGKATFEVLAKNVKEYREGSVKLRDSISDEKHVFKSSRKIASKAELFNAFETENVLECLKIIMDSGKAQISVDENKVKTENRRKEMMNLINKRYINPKTKNPHPMTRIEGAFDKIIGLIIDPKVPAHQQIDDLKLVRKLIDTGLFLKENEGYVEELTDADKAFKKNKKPKEYKEYKDHRIRDTKKKGRNQGNKGKH